jgi:hypothetical protein
MENRGLLFIPDISGFTRFVNEIEIEHSRHIIQQLLEVLINSNQIGLEISEVEGDAILFYKFGEPLNLETLYRQVERMFIAFHRHLIIYENRKICQCKACISAVNLSLKVISHYGEFAFYNVKQFNKLIGRDVIIAHQLLKNDIPQHEYWLVTENLGERPAGLTQWMQWNNSNQQTETGKIAFYYTQLSPLKNEIPPDPIPHLDLTGKTKLLSVSRDYNVSIKTLCYTVVHFDLRHLWLLGIKRIDEIEHFLPEIGTRHRHVLENGKTSIKYISGFVYNPVGRTIFSETDERDRTTICYIADKVGDNTSRLTIDYYMPPNLVKQTIFKIFKKDKMQERFVNSLRGLDKVVTEMVLPLEF